MERTVRQARQRAQRVVLGGGNTPPLGPQGGQVGEATLRHHPTGEAYQNPDRALFGRSAEERRRERLRRRARHTA